MECQPTGGAAHPASDAASPLIEITVNGEPKRVTSGTTVLALVKSLGVDPERVAVEVDRQLVKRPTWESRAVDAGAEVEIVMFVGGG